MNGIALASLRVSWVAIVLATLLARGAPAAIDPVTPDHPLWTIAKGQAAIDGSLSDPDWALAAPIVRAQPWRGDGTATIRMLYSAAGLYVSAEVDDRSLWADGQGSGTGFRWEIESDDSFIVYVDPDASRDEYFQATDRAFGANLGNAGNAINGAGAVRRCKFIRGDGGFGAPDVVGCDVVATFQAQTGIQWATAVVGTVNNAADQDSGWTTEMFLPWAALNRAAPSHGDVMAMNFDVIFDNAGGGRDNFTNNRVGPNRFTAAAVIDDQIQGAQSSYHDTLAGLRGPVSYAEAMFVDAAAAAAPAAIVDLTAVGASAFGARLLFTAPAGVAAGNKGHAAAYQVRRANAPITTEMAWTAAEEVAQRYVPRLRGQPEMLRIARLAPSTTHYVAVRAVDAAGHPGPLSNSASFTTTAMLDGSDRGRIIPAPNGAGLIFENGTPFVPVGDHLGIAWAYYRNLYPADVWDPFNLQFLNFYEQPGFEGPAAPHFTALAAKGVNTLRVFLELLNTNQTGNPSPMPVGRHWIEFPNGTYNPDLRALVLGALEQAAANGIYLIFSPFDTFTWDEAFTTETPWYFGNGGPLADINDFFQSPATLQDAKDRLREVMDWVESSPYKDHLLGWEPLNEWDSYEWTLNAEGGFEPGRETEMRRRSIWIRALNQYVREQAPNHLVLSSSVQLDPRGPVHRELFYDRGHDVVAMHFYTNSSEEPINNPATDKSVLAAIESGNLSAYWLTHRQDHRPFVNAEWGMTSLEWPGLHPAYQAGYTQTQDEDLYRAISWSGFAAGQAGQGLRIANDELASNFSSLTGAMRDVQLSMSRFVSGSLYAAFAENFAPASLVGELSLSSAAGKALLAWGAHDAENGVVYVLQNGNTSSGSVGDGVLTIRGLPDVEQIAVQYWATSGSSSSPLAETTATPSGGTVALALPAFDRDLVVVFAPEPGPLLAQLAALSCLAALALIAGRPNGHPRRMEEEL